MNTPLPFAEQLVNNEAQQQGYLVTNIDGYRATLNHFAGLGELFLLRTSKDSESLAIVTGNPNNSSASLLLRQLLEGDLSQPVVATRLGLDLVNV